MDQLCQSSIQALVRKVKQEMLSSPSTDLYSFVSPSAYDTAWLAMIPDPHRHDRPMFGECLDWVLNSQREEGFWGGFDGGDGVPSIDSLPATLACMVALRKWNHGAKHVEKGLAFIQANAEKVLRGNCNPCPCWFVIVFPAMVELASTVDLEIIVSDGLKAILGEILNHRLQILKTEEVVGKYHYPPLISYLEALPSWYDINEENIVKHLTDDGSLFQSPSATARAFMMTGKEECKDYLQSLLQRCPTGVPAMYPMDEELIKLSMVNQLQRLGLAQHFTQEIDEILSLVYRNHMNGGQGKRERNLVPAQLYKDSLAFRLLRMHGYTVSPWSFCWFLHHEDILDHIKNNSQHFSSLLLSIYGATDLMFSGEYELEEARSFSRNLLDKNMPLRHINDSLVVFPNFQSLIEHELSIPWIARLDHLDHRKWIEINENNTLWMGKASFYRLSCLDKDELMQLAMENYKFLQSIYSKELVELTRWSKDLGLSSMGFGREKTTYCYFAAAAASSSLLPHITEVRLIIAKSAILITVADDFFDMQGSLNELKTLTEAIRRWDGQGLTGHCEVIFKALDTLVNDIAAKYLYQQGGDQCDITKSLQDLWYETFSSWLMEAKWSKTGDVPNSEEYLQTGMISIAAHVIVLLASCFLNPGLPIYKLRPAQYETITKLLMITTRLLNDIQSYQKEQVDGKKNLVLLYQRENPDMDIEDSVSYVRGILNEKKKELVEHVLSDGSSDLPNSVKHLHLSCLKVFHMFFNSSNGYDSNTEMLQDIKKAIYIPLEFQTSKPSIKPLPLPSQRKKEISTVNAHLYRNFKHPSKRSLTAYPIPSPVPRVGYEKMFMPLTLKSCFI